MDAASRPSVGLTRNDLAMLLVVLIWGANFSFLKAALTELQPLVIATLRFAFAGLVLFLLLMRSEGRRALPSRRQFLLLFGIGLAGNTLYQLFFMNGVRFTSAANASLITSTSPAIVAVFAAALRIEQLQRRTVAGIALAIAGVAVVLLAGGHLAIGGDNLTGDLLILGSAAAWSVYTLGVRAFGNQLSPLAITTWTMLAGTPGIVAFALPDLLTTDWPAVSPAAWSGVVASALLALVLCYIIWNRSVRAVGSARTAIYSSAIPLVAALVAWPALGEVPNWGQALGGLLIVAGVLLSRRA
jgi:drug/metabolite transporter (DMT)-like permease